MKKLFLLLISIMVFAFPYHCHAHHHNGVVQDAENYIVEDVSLPKKSVDKIIRYLEEAVIEMYSEYYTISEIRSEIRKIEFTNEKVELFFVEDDVLLTMDEIKPESREKLNHAGMQTAQSLILSSVKEDLSSCFTNMQNILLSVSEDDNTTIARECVKEWVQMWLSGKTSRAVIKLVLLSSQLFELTSKNL